MNNLIMNLGEPTVFQECIGDWPGLSWSLDDWSQKIGDKPLPFRFGTKKFTKLPQWEGDCVTRNLSLKEFIHIHGSATDDLRDRWCYFDYKHMHEWFQDNSEILQSVNWSNLGFPDRGGRESTLWISSEGAHTPCHTDTYGCNLVAQLSGRKQWILFPPHLDDQLKPTRVPYEESSVFSEINFYSPSKDLKLQEAHVVILEPGDVLFVPAGWWHYVETLSQSAISINTWIPLPGDKIKQLQEALVRSWVSTICRLSPSSSVNTLVNPNETDVSDDPDLLVYLKRAFDQCQEEPATKKRRLSTLDEAQSSCSSDHSKLPKELLSVKTVPLKKLSVQEFSNLMQQKRSKFKTDVDQSCEESDSELIFSKKLINAVCDKEVISCILGKLLTQNKS